MNSLAAFTPLLAMQFAQQVAPQASEPATLDAWALVKIGIIIGWPSLRSS